jgi:hypothetical protein
LAAATDETLPGCRCDKALPPPALELLPVFELRKTDDAFEPTVREVVSPFFAITFLLWSNA